MAQVAEPVLARDERLARIGLAGRLFQRPEIGSMVGVLAVFFLFLWSAGAKFAELDGFALWTDEASNVGIMAVPVALLMIGGEFDLSAGVMTGSAGLLLGYLVTRPDLNVWPAILLVLLFGMVIGFVNGMLVMKTRLPSFIVTLGTFFSLAGLNAGLTRRATGSVYIPDIDTASGFSSAHRFLGSTFTTYAFPDRVIWWIAITLVATWVLSRTRFGNWIFAVGGDATAARNVGVPVLRTKIALFMTTSTMASLLGIMIALQIRSAQADQGIGNEFVYIIAAVVGGCLLTGGYGSAVGASIGALIMGMITVGIPFSNWNTDYQRLFLGVILLLAVMLNTLIRWAAARSRS